MVVVSHETETIRHPLLLFWVKLEAEWSQGERRKAPPLFPPLFRSTILWKTSLASARILLGKSYKMKKLLLHPQMLLRPPLLLDAGKNEWREADTLVEETKPSSWNMRWAIFCVSYEGNIGNTDTARKRDKRDFFIPTPPESLRKGRWKARFVSRIPDSKMKRISWCPLTPIVWV